MNLEKVIFGFFILLAATLNFGFVIGDIADPAHHNINELYAAVVVNLIATDERIFNFRHPLPTHKRLERYAMLVLCGRQRGLVCSITRLVHFGRLPDDLRRKAEAPCDKHENGECDCGKNDKNSNHKKNG